MFACHGAALQTLCLAPAGLDANNARYPTLRACGRCVCNAGWDTAAGVGASDSFCASQTTETSLSPAAAPASAPAPCTATFFCDGNPTTAGWILLACAVVIAVAAAVLLICTRCCVACWPCVAAPAAAAAVARPEKV